MKIVDGVDLKVLLLYGFHRYPAPIKEYYKVVYIDNDRNRFIEYSVKTNDRRIIIHTVNFDDHFKNRYYLDNTLYELMLDKLIEEVKEDEEEA